MLNALSDRLKLKRFAAARGGAAAVEFALIAPVLIMIYLALAELTLGMMASRRASHLAASVGDLVAQSEVLTNANMNDIFDIGASILEPFPATDLKIRVSTVEMGTDNVARVVWSDPRNWDAHAPGEVIPGITATQLPQGETLVMTDVEYTYSNDAVPVPKFLSALTTFRDTFYHHPRAGKTVGRNRS